MFIKSLVIKNDILQKIEPVFSKWIDLNIEYMEHYKFEDCMFWYNERTNVSALAGAVWQLGGLALEEYSAEKMAKQSRYSGRRDLFFTWHDQSYLCEAKCQWLKYRRGAEPKTEDYSSSLSEALTDLECSIKGGTDAKHGLALVFIVPYGHKAPIEPTAADKLLEAIRTDSKVDFSAYIGLTEKTIIAKKSNNHYQDVILIGQYKEK
jgi:hypothetical protein